MDSSLDVILRIHHRPYPLVGTYHHDNDPSDQIAYIGLDLTKLAYKRVDNRLVLHGQQYNALMYDE